MGNNHSNDLKHGSKTKKASEELSPVKVAAQVEKIQGESRGMIRSASGSDIQDRSTGSFQPVEKLAKFLHKRTDEEFGGSGIIAEAFARHVFPAHPALGHRLFAFLHAASKAKTPYMGTTAFRQQCDRFLGLLDDSLILENYVRMFGELEHPEQIRPEHLRALLTTCFRLATSQQNQSCRWVDRTLDAVIASCFFSKESLSSGYVTRWLEEHCPRLIVPPLHKFVVHTLTTAYRELEAKEGADATDGGGGGAYECPTPVLEMGNPLAELEKQEKSPPNLPLSMAWLLAGCLPPLYSLPAKQKAPSPPSALAGATLASQAFLAKLLATVPSHWTQLYDSRTDGIGANRFLHHVLNYKGPTLVLLKGEDDLLLCIAAPGEWRETHLYTGGADACVLQLHPKFQAVVQRAPNSLYLNTSIRGYPKGLRAGTDPRKPVIAVDEGFERLEFRGLGGRLLAIEVWGCGDPASRETQLEIKKWQVKEAERQRAVKLTAADWMENPDRYLLEMGGRPQYNTSNK